MGYSSLLVATLSTTLTTLSFSNGLSGGLYFIYIYNDSGSSLSVNIPDSSLGNTYIQSNSINFSITNQRYGVLQITYVYDANNNRNIYYITGYA